MDDTIRQHKFTLTEDQKLIAESARKVAAGFGLDYWRQQDEAKAFPHAFWKAVCDAGLCGAALRLPITPLTPAGQALVGQALQEAGLS